MDIFAYNPDNGYRIDSYSRIACADEIQLTLTTGPKRLVVLSGLDTKSLHYADIVSMDHLRQVCGRLEEEKPEHPLLSGLADIDASVAGCAARLLWSVGSDFGLPDAALKDIDTRIAAHFGEKAR